MEFSHHNQINVHVVLHILLIAALVWLPVMGLTVDVLAEKQPSSDYIEKNVMTVDAPMMLQSHQMNASSQMPLFSKEPIHTTGNDCVGHQAPCRGVCAPYYGASIFLRSSVTLSRIERCQQRSGSLAVVVLVRDLRPPIA